ncbi:trigger factor [uncultured Mailhella sp.]|uniref:trigger factor n=1 Tax=uncultured Mailhella sp. TaxID=1981031 RepID=UPI00261CA922|nr:trigger factor [uncultured Mailhella sp.]
MSHTVEVLSPVSRKISVTVPAEEVNAALDAAARQIGASVSLPGFRKGKAPIAAIEKRFAGDVTSRAMETLVERRVAEILKEEDLKPLSRLDFNGDPIVRGQELKFSFSFETLPDVKLPEDLSAVKVEMGSTEATDQDIEELTKRMLKAMATLEDVTEHRLPEDGDVVTFDADGEVDGKPVPGMKAKDYTIQLAAPQDGMEFSELDKILRGLHAGEEGSGTMVCPEDHVDENLRGKTVDLHVKLHKISREVLPELNDEYAKKVGFADEAALRRSLAEEAGRNKASAAREEAERKILEKLLADQDFPLPESLVKARREEYESEVRSYLSRGGLDKDAIENSLKGMEEDCQKQAEERARAQIFLTALARREKIEVSEQEVDMQIMRMAREYKQDFRKLRDLLYQNGAVNDLHDRIATAKAMELLFDKAEKVRAEAAAE